MMSDDGDKLGKRKLLVGKSRKWIVVLVVFVCLCICAGVGLWIWTSHPLAATWYSNVRGQAGMEYVRLGFNRDHTGFYEAKGATHPIRWKGDGNVLEMEIIDNGTFWTGEKKLRSAYTIENPKYAGMPKLMLVLDGADQRTVEFTKAKLIPGP